MATSTSTGPTITPSPTLFFRTIPQAVTCNSLQIPWLYEGPASTISLVITNVGVSQDLPPPPPSISSPASTKRNTFTNHEHNDRRAIPTGATEPLSQITSPIASNIDPISSSFFWWQLVNVPQGWYNITAMMASPAYQASSHSFFVRTGSDTSCLTEVTSTTSVVAPSSTASLIPSASSPVIIVGGAKSTRLAMIVGICIGGFVIVMMVLAAWWFMLKKKAVIKSTKGGKGSRGSRYTSKPSAKWSGLGHKPSANKSFPSPHYQTHSSSKATIPVNASQEILSAEKNSVYGDPFNGPAVGLSTFPVLQQQARRSKMGSRTYSASSSTSNGFGGINDFVSSPAPVRRPSVPDSVIGRQSIDSTSSNAYPPSPVSPFEGRARNSSHFTPAIMSRSQSISAASHSHQPSLYSPSQSPSSYDPLHQSHPSNSTSFLPTNVSNTITYDGNVAISTSAKQANRQSLGGKKRKPVPAYDPDESSPPSPYGNSQTTSPASPSPPSPVPDQSSVNGSVGGHYGTRSQGGQDSGQHNLSHKSSFGPGGIEGKPLHYLIPDMPMPQKD